MNKETYQSTEPESHNWLNLPWLRGHSKRTVTFPVPLHLVRKRLEKAFDQPIKKSGGFFFPTFTYSAQIIDNQIELQFSKSGKNGMSFDMSGHFFEDANGTRLEMTIKNTLSTFFRAVFILALIGFLIYVKKETTFFWIVPFFLLGSVAYNHNEASDMIVELIDKIVSKEEP